MFVDVPLQDPMRGEGARPWRLPAWLRTTCRLCFGDDCAWPTARAFSGEVDTGSPQKMRSRKNKQSEFQFHRNGTRSRVEAALRGTHENCETSS
jgi:hypothetical protein